MKVMRSSVFWLAMCSACTGGFLNPNDPAGSTPAGNGNTATPGATTGSTGMPMMPPGQSTGATTGSAGNANHALGSCAGLPGPCSTALDALPLTGCVLGDYTANVTVGSGMTFAMTIDSGSTTVAVAAATCTNCTPVMPEYNTDASAMPTTQSVTSTYGDGSGWTGTVIKDNVKLDPNGPVIDLAFAAITKQNMGTSGRNFFAPTYCKGVATSNTSQGIFGLGSTRAALTGTDTYLDKLTTGTKVADAFAFQACDMNGRLWMGGYDPNFISAPPVFTPMDDTYGVYLVSLTDLQVNGKTAGLTTASFGLTVEDTGTSIFLMPAAAFNAVSKLVEADPNYVSEFGAGFLANGTNCTPAASGASKKQLDAKLPPLTMMFAGQNGGAPVPVNLPATESYLTPSVTPTGATCYVPAIASSGGTASTTQPSTIIGNSTMHSHVVIFDRGNKQLGFAPQVGCTALP